MSRKYVYVVITAYTGSGADCPVDNQDAEVVAVCETKLSAQKAMRQYIRDCGYYDSCIDRYGSVEEEWFEATDTYRDICETIQLKKVKVEH